MPNSEESRQRSHKGTMQQVTAKPWTGQPYPAYKDSGVEWLGKVPEHWDVLPSHACFQEKLREPNAGLREKTVLSLSYGRIVIKPPEKLHGLVPSSFETYQIVDPLDIVVRPTDLQNDQQSLRFDLSMYRGIISSAYMCLRANSYLMPEYTYLLLHAYDLKKVFYGLGSGLRQNLSWEDFKYLPCCVPMLKEQRAIAHFLDHANKRIQRYIHAKEKLIKLLEEQKQVIIYQAVTGQIDVRTGKPYPVCKDSGVEWLGEVPQSWRIFRLKGVVANVTDLTKELDGDNIYLALEHVESWTGKFSTMNSSVDFDSQAKRFQSGDVLFGKLRPYLAKVVCPERDGICAGEFLVLRSHYAGLLPKYFEQLLRSKPVISAIDASTFGAKMPRADWQFIGNMRIPLPPLSEQHAIAHFLTDTCQRISAACAAVKREIELFHEYRTRLIADVVTGKLDVREAAAALPEENPPTGGDNCQDGTQVQSRCP